MVKRCCISSTKDPEPCYPETRLKGNIDPSLKAFLLRPFYLLWRKGGFAIVNGNVKEIMSGMR